MSSQVSNKFKKHFEYFRSNSLKMASTEATAIRTCTRLQWRLWQHGLTQRRPSQLARTPRYFSSIAFRSGECFGWATTSHPALSNARRLLSFHKHPSWSWTKGTRALFPWTQISLQSTVFENADIHAFGRVDARTRINFWIRTNFP